MKRKETAVKSTKYKHQKNGKFKLNNLIKITEKLKIEFKPETGSKNGPERYYSGINTP